MESMQPALELVLGAIFGGATDPDGGSSDIPLAISNIFKGLLQHLLSLRWTKAAMAGVLGHYLQAFGPYLKHVPNAVGDVLNKLFELLTSLPISLKDPSTQHARLLICTSFIHLAKTADKSLLPHLKEIADTVFLLRDEGQLLPAEENLLGEAFIVMASSDGLQQQKVLAWLLGPLSKEWTQIEWQTVYFSDPSGLVHLCSDTSCMWSIFHRLTFFERALQTSGIRNSNPNVMGSLESSNSMSTHPMASHLSWMLPPLLKLLRVVHALWSQEVTQGLPGEMKAALSMSDVEIASVLEEGNARVSKGQVTFKDESPMDVCTEGHAVLDENDIRNWLTGIRDSGYNVLGLSATIGDSLFKYLDSDTVALALVENIKTMEFRHIKKLVHQVLIPLIKHCPMELWEEVLERFLHPLLVHCQKALSCSWSNLREVRAQVPDISVNPFKSEMKVEVLEEKLLRDLSREICSLLSVLASPSLNVGLPSLEQIGHISHTETSSTEDVDAFASNSLIGILLKHRGSAVPALEICLEAFSWTDGESVTKIASFCRPLIALAILTTDSALRQYVAKDLFYAIIQGFSLDSNAFASADLVGLCCDIFIYLGCRDLAPREVLLSFPSIRPSDLADFQEALTKTTSTKEKKQHMRSLLLLATQNNPWLG